MIDFTDPKLRPLIWQERMNLADFFIDEPRTLDSIMFDRIQESMICDLEGAAQYVLDIFNNAYYITTLILMEKRPVLYLISYINISLSAGSGNNTYQRYFSAMTMAMVYNYLRASDEKYLDGTHALMKRIWDYHKEHYHDDQWDSKARFLFYNNVLPSSEIEKHKIHDLFVPRRVFNVICYEDAETIIKGQGLNYVIDSIISLRKTEEAIFCFDELIKKLERSNILEKDKFVREVEDIKKEFRCIREEPPIRRGKHGNLIEQPETESVSEEAPCSREDELMDMIRNLQSELKKVQEEKQTAETALKEYMERNQNRRGINGHLVALLGLKLAPKLGISFSNKKQLAPVLSNLFGWGRRKLEQELSKNTSYDDDLALAQIFAELSPELAKFICPKWQGTLPSETKAPSAE
jgi:hypothetical protein